MEAHRRGTLVNVVKQYDAIRYRLEKEGRRKSVEFIIAYPSADVHPVHKGRVLRHYDASLPA